MDKEPLYVIARTYNTFKLWCRAHAPRLERYEVHYIAAPDDLNYALSGTIVTVEGFPERPDWRALNEMALCRAMHPSVRLLTNHQFERMLPT